MVMAMEMDMTMAVAVAVAMAMAMAMAMTMTMAMAMTICCAKTLRELVRVALQDGLNTTFYTVQVALATQSLG